MVKSDFLVDQPNWKAELRSALTRPGERSVMSSGHLMMLMSSVVNLDSLDLVRSVVIELRTYMFLCNYT